jgi:uncharacterized protein YndB with AHSA1/START domain
MHLHRTVTIGAPPAVVWRCLTDPDFRPKWLSNFVSEEPDEPGRTGAGTSATVRLRQNNRVVEYRSSVIEWDPERRLSVGLTGGGLPKDEVMGVIYTLSPGDGPAGTAVDYDFHFPVRNWFFKLLSPLIRLGAGKQIEINLANLKALAESLANEGEGT